ncbi:MAG: hypothetical protein HYY60_01405 [Parcubacteria group bacterium]|nr:hypothetical protein [Parcubacteria group bacterium]
MVKILKWNTYILLLQIAAFVGEWFVSRSFDNALVTSSVAAILFCLGPIFSSSIPGLVFTLATGAGLASTYARIIPVFVSLIANPSVPLLAIVSILLLLAAGVCLFALIVAREEKKNGAVEPYWALFIAALPLGLGTVFGGALYFFAFKPRAVSA